VRRPDQHCLARARFYNRRETSQSP
jgi:hypothetical protein